MVRRLIERLADVMAAIAFAEEGEHETARRLLADADRLDPRHARAPREQVLPAVPRPHAKSS